MDEEKKINDQQEALIEISMEMLRQRGKENVLIKTASIILITVMLILNIFVIYTNYQWKLEVMEYISTLEVTTTETTTQTVDGEGKINNVDGNQYNDSETHNGGQ